MFIFDVHVSVLCDPSCLVFSSVVTVLDVTSCRFLGCSVRSWSLITGRGGDTKREGGGT